MKTLQKWIRPLFRVPDGAREEEVINLLPLAVAEGEPWWVTVHRLIDSAEWETIEGARNASDTTKCVAAVGAGEGIALVRRKLIEARQVALRQMEINQGG